MFTLAFTSNWNVSWYDKINKYRNSRKIWYSQCSARNLSNELYVKHFKRNQIVYHITFTHYHRSLFCIFGENEMKKCSNTVQIKLKTDVFFLMILTGLIYCSYPRYILEHWQKNLNIIIQHYHFLTPQWQSLLWQIGLCKGNLNKMNISGW